MASQVKYHLVFCLLYCAISFGKPVFAQSISSDVNDLKYFYFPSADQKIEINFNNVSSLNSASFRAATKTILIVDGFMSDSTSPMSTRMKNDYTRLGDQNNVIVLDWGKLSGSGTTVSNPVAVVAAYLVVLGNVENIGKRNAEFLNFLQQNKQIQFSDVTIVGHSMGAHIAGLTGVAVRNNYNQVVSRVAGLDPAGPFYSLQLSQDKRVHSGQASLVDLYHTNRGALGDPSYDKGDIDIFINGGDNQPGCEEADASGFPGYCSHSYSWKFFSAAFDNSKIACPCNSNLACTCTLSSSASCSAQGQCDDGFVVGPNIDPSVRGRFYATSGLL